MNTFSITISCIPMEWCHPVILLGGIFKQILVIRNSINVIPCFNKGMTNWNITIAGCFVDGTSVIDLSTMFQQ